MLSLLRREPSEPSGLVEDMEDPQDCSGFKDEDLYNVGPQGNMGIYEYSIVYLPYAECVERGLCSLTSGQRHPW